MLTPGMLDLFTTFIESHCEPEQHAEIFDALQRIPPTSTAQPWLIGIELSARLDGFDAHSHCALFGGYLHALQLAREEECPKVTMAHVMLGLNEVLAQMRPGEFYSLVTLEERLLLGASKPGYHPKGDRFARRQARKRQREERRRNFHLN